MVQTKSSSGKMIDIQMLGIAEVTRRLRDTGKEIEKGADFGVVRAGAFVEEEVKESISGRRAEQRSVDTGLFANSIEFNKIRKAQGVVNPKSKTYPGTSITTVEVAGIMEKKRNHFRNTKSRTANKVKDIINIEIKGKL